MLLPNGFSKVQKCERQKEDYVMQICSTYSISTKEIVRSIFLLVSYSVLLLLAIPLQTEMKH